MKLTTNRMIERTRPPRARSARRLRVLASIACAASLTVLAACGAEDPASDGTETIKVGVYPGTLVNLPMYVASENGIFKAHGLDATLVSFDSAPPGLAALYGGSIDLLSNSTGNMLLANSKQTQQGKKLVNVTDNYPGQVWGYIVRPEVSANRCTDFPACLTAFKGKKIGVPAVGSEGQYQLKLLLEQAGLDADKDVKYVGIGLGPSAVSAFKAGTVDVALGIEPVSTTLVSAGGLEFLNLRTDATIPLFKDWSASTWETTVSHADKRKDAMSRFQDAQKEAIAFIKDPANLDTVAAIWVKNNQSLSEKDAKSILNANAEAFNAEINCKGIDNVGEFYRQNKLLKDADIETCDELTWSGAQSLLK